MVSAPNLLAANVGLSTVMLTIFTNLLSPFLYRAHKHTKLSTCFNLTESIGLFEHNVIVDLCDVLRWLVSEKYETCLLRELESRYVARTLKETWSNHW